MTTIWVFLFLVPVLRGLCELGTDFHKPLLWPLLGMLLVAPALAASDPGSQWRRFRKLLGWVGLLTALLLMRRANLQILDTRNGTDMLLLAVIGVSALGAGLGSPLGRGASLGTWIWITGWSLTGLLNPWLPVLGAALGGCLEALGGLPELAETDSGQASRFGFPLAVLLGLALPKPFWDYGFAPQADLSMVAFGGGTLLALVLRAKGRSLPTWLPVAVLVLMTTLYHSPLPAASSGLLGVATGFLLNRLVARPAALLGGMLLGISLSFVLHANLQVFVIRAWAWWGA